MPFIDGEIAAAYGETPRFDEGHFFNDPEYDALYRRYLDVEDAIAVNFSPAQQAIVDRRLEFEREICELECRHYFEEGWLQGRQREKA